MDGTFPCPKCGQPLTPPPHAVSMQCPACKNFIIIPDSAIHPTGESLELPAVQPGQRQAIVDRVRAGDKIGAIKLYRQSTGAGLKAAKDAVEGMGVNQTLANSTVLPYAGQQSSGKAGNLGSQEAMRNLVLQVLAGGDKIEAIKRYRELTGADLNTAKEAVEAIERAGAGRTMGGYPTYTAGSPAAKRMILVIAVGMAVFSFILVTLILFAR